MGTTGTPAPSNRDVSHPHPLLPQLAPQDLILRRKEDGWHVERARGGAVCEPLASLAEARLVGRTFAAACGRVWVYEERRWCVLDGD